MTRHTTTDGNGNIVHVTHVDVFYSLHPDDLRRLAECLEVARKIALREWVINPGMTTTLDLDEN